MSIVYTVQKIGEIFLIVLETLKGSGEESSYCRKRSTWSLLNFPFFCNGGLKKQYSHIKYAFTWCFQILFTCIARYVLGCKKDLHPHEEGGGGGRLKVWTNEL